MPDVGRGGLDSEGFGLGTDPVFELDGCYKHAHNPAFLEVFLVVHTARRAAASVGQGFDDRVAADRDLVAQVLWADTRGELSTTGGLPHPLAEAPEALRPVPGGPNTSAQRLYRFTCTTVAGGNPLNQVDDAWL
jgi:hypothetical protein